MKDTSTGQALSVYSQFFHAGEVVELRGLGLRGKNTAWSGFAGGKAGIVSGYFNDGAKLAAAAELLDKAGARGVYFTVNPVSPPLMARASNRLVCPKEDETTNDLYISCLRWFLVDLDAALMDGARRPKGISATGEEMAACQKQAEEVARYLEGEHGFAKAIRAFSGNGYHLNYRIPDLPNDDKHRALVKNVMAALASKFGPVIIDVSVVNPARIWKYYGTTARKGDNTPERPHRLAYIFPGQPDHVSDVPVTSIETFQKFSLLANASAASSSPATSAQVKPPPATERAAGDHNSQAKARPIKRSELGPIDIEKYLSHYGISHTVKETDHPQWGPATAYLLSHCIFNSDHSGKEASIIVPRAGAIKYQCFHASCKSRTWKDARLKISGDQSLAQFCQGYDPNWTPPKQTGTGMMADLPTPMTDSNSLKNGVGGGPPVPQPTDVDPKEFYEKKGKRPVFVPFYLAKYLAAYLHPICHTQGVFYHYEDGVWNKFPETALAQICVHAMREEIQAAWIKNCTSILAGMVNREEDEWPDYPTMVNVKNGMLNIETMEFTPHDPIWGSRTQLPVSYKPESGWSERWIQFLKEIFDDDVDMSKVGLLQQFFGYCLLRDTRFQRALFLYGTGANGKSTVLDVLSAMLGAENTASLTLQDLNKQFRAQFLQNKLANISTETDTRDPVTTNILKAVIDGSPLTTEQKYGTPFQYRPFAKWLVAMNEAPVIPDKTYGFGRRILVLYFNRRLTPEEINEKMSEYLIEEIDGVFNWAVDGLAVLLKNRKFKIGKQVQDDTDKLMEVMNPLLVFVVECCAIDDGKEAGYYTFPKDLWHAYTEWCLEGKNRAMGRNKFYEQLLATYMRVRKGRKEMPDGTSPTVFHGLYLTSTGRDYADRGGRRSEKIMAS